MPSSMKTAYPEMRHPPSVRGGSQLTVMEVRVLEMILGWGKDEGEVHTAAESTFDQAPAPL